MKYYLTNISSIINPIKSKVIFTWDIFTYSFFYYQKNTPGFLIYTLINSVQDLDPDPPGSIPFEIPASESGFKNLSIQIRPILQNIMLTTYKL